jgi:hypothetical protein
MMASVSRASETEPRNNAIPVIVEAHTWKGRALLVLYYPDSETLCFINETSKVFVDIVDFSPKYKQLVHSKVESALRGERR